MQANLNHLFYDRQTLQPMYNITDLEESVGRDHLCAFVNQLPVVVSADYTTEAEMDCWLRHINATVPHLHPKRYLEDSDEIRAAKENLGAVLTLSVPPEMTMVNAATFSKLLFF